MKYIITKQYKTVKLWNQFTNIPKSKLLNIMNVKTTKFNVVLEQLTLHIGYLDKDIVVTAAMHIAFTPERGLTVCCLIQK